MSRIAENRRETGFQQGLGKLPPQAIDLEEAVLGAVLSERDAITEIADILTPKMFYVEANQLIFEECCRLSLDSQPIDILTVTQALRASGNLEQVGGPFYLTGLSDRVMSSANIEYHARIVAQKYVQREMIIQSTRIIEACYTDTEDIFDTMAAADFGRDELLTQISTRKESSNIEVVTDTLRDIEEAQLSPHRGLTGITSGFSKLDDLTGGWQQSDLVILAARPAMGKTSNAITMAINAARSQKPVAVFSLEMSSKQLANKELSIVSGVPFSRIRKKVLNPEDWQVIHSKMGEISSLPIHWDDTPGISITELCAKAKRLKRKHGIELIIVDYLQLITTGNRQKSGNREQEVGFISRTLKGLAKELDIPVIALSQLSRAVESRPGNGKRPMLSDLRESGSIEQDADIVMFLYRPEYYGITEDEIGSSTEGMAELIVAKHRNGACEDIQLRFDKYTTGFTDWETEDTWILPPPSPNTGISPNGSFDDGPF
ncbi:replicative DNA helicase [Parapedobacter indicus]|uniref:Replicative DNA helicase n=1 Tax=Parapedobacter indicus TaxID=1477437 RepID=A0A1I3E1I2_9SPHI|nr:replicative DNA helicase [Parapedobacter indicus]PPL04929.1 primary replicative DNA helicase [Parapedobacter indicus]SFH92837.1 primary replicative DNA helicase [Parapedobacter indicus]